MKIEVLENAEVWRNTEQKVKLEPGFYTYSNESRTFFDVKDKNDEILLEIPIFIEYIKAHPEAFRIIEDSPEEKDYTTEAYKTIIDEMKEGLTRWKKIYRKLQSESDTRIADLESDVRQSNVIINRCDEKVETLTAQNTDLEKDIKSLMDSGVCKPEEFEYLKRQIVIHNRRADSREKDFKRLRAENTALESEMVGYQRNTKACCEDYEKKTNDLQHENSQLLILVSETEKRFRGVLKVCNVVENENDSLKSAKSAIIREARRWKGLYVEAYRMNSVLAKVNAEVIATAEWFSKSVTALTIERDHYKRMNENLIARAAKNK